MKFRQQRTVGPPDRIAPGGAWMNGKRLDHAERERGAADAAARKAHGRLSELVESPVEVRYAPAGEIGAVDRFGLFAQHVFGRQRRRSFGRRRRLPIPITESLEK